MFITLESGGNNWRSVSAYIRRGGPGRSKLQKVQAGLFGKRSAVSKMSVWKDCRRSLSCCQRSRQVASLLVCEKASRGYPQSKNSEAKRRTDEEINRLDKFG